MHWSTGKKEVDATMEPTTDDTEKIESKETSAPVLLIILVIDLGESGAVYYLKFKKQRPMLDVLPDEPEYTTEPEAVYPSENTGLPYDIVVEHICDADLEEILGYQKEIYKGQNELLTRLSKLQ
jgi:hypothetical protein